MVPLHKLANCPVCPTGDNWLGYIVKGEVCSYLCNDCQFIYSWDTKGKLMKPVKYKPTKSWKGYCGPAGCVCRD
jgi:transposase-like protein